MPNSKYVDMSAIMQTIGCIYNNPSLLEDQDKYSFNEDDFPDEFHKMAFGSIYKLYELGAKKITIENIIDFLESRPKYKALFELQKGAEWFTKASENAQPTAFDYYYNRLKKMSLLRAYDNYGIDVSFLYDPDNIFDASKKQFQEELLDNSTLEDLANKIDARIDEIRSTYVDDTQGIAHDAGEGIFDLIEQFKETPEVGIPLYGPYINTVTKGARLKKFYLRSAPTGVGKTRSMVADCCNIGCNEIYNEQFGIWIKNGIAEPVLYITTEQELSEVQTMMLAFLSAVPEDHILDGKYIGDEEDRVLHAAELLAASSIKIEEMPDFSLQDIENKIKKHIREDNISYIFLDYIHTSLKILEEITKKSGGVKLREDNILFMLSIRLKDICNKYGVFILSSTQLNGDYQTSETPDQNLLRGQ